MKCELCKRKTTWDYSVGRKNFIVCNDCINKISKVRHKTDFEIAGDIIKIGFYKDIVKER